MMTGGNGDVFRTGILDSLHPSVCVELRRVEGLSQLRVFLIANVLVLHHPLAHSHHRVEPPMQEDTELLILKLLTCLNVFRRGMIGFLCPTRVRKEHDYN